MKKSNSPKINPGFRRLGILQEWFSMKFFCCILLFVLYSGAISGNEWPDYEVKNFNKKAYRASNQNWSVDTSSDGFVYFANHWGLLVFDGINWELHKLPNETIMRSVLVASDSLIYTSGYRELGYWKVDKNRDLFYHSLNDLAEKYFSKNEESWQISILDSQVFFHSYSKIYRYDLDSIVPLAAPGIISSQFRIDDRIFVAVKDKGIYTIGKDGLIPCFTDSFFRNKIVRFILSFGNHRLLIGTKSDGIYTWDGTGLSEWNPAWSDYFRRNEVNRAIINHLGQLVVGTILDGITIFNPDGALVSSYNTTNGLQNNTVLGLAMDRFNNIWIGLDSGIDFLSANGTKGFQIETIPGIGAVYDAAILGNRIYLGTNQGLFTRNLQNKSENYQLVMKTQGHIWDCCIIGNNIVIGHNTGFILVKDMQAENIFSQTGGFSIREDPLRDGYFIGSTYGNLVVLRQDGNTLKTENTIKGFSDLIRYVETDHLGNIWAGHMHLGIYKLQLNSSRDSVVSVAYFGQNSVLGKDYSIHVFKIENRIVFTTGTRLYTYDDLKDSIVSYTSINNQLSDFSAAVRIIPAPDHHYWFITGQQIGLFRIMNQEVNLIKSYPRSLFTENEMIENYENIVPVTATSAIVCLERGIAHLDVSVPDSGSRISSFLPELREIKFSDRSGKADNGTISNDGIHVRHKYPSIQLRYSFPHFTAGQLLFSSFLKGLDQDWSEWLEKPDFSFDRLPPGDYELLVKAVDDRKNESRVSAVKIRIAPPPWSTVPAKMGYTLLGIGFFLLLRHFSIRKVKKKEQLLHEKREQELIRLRNENLRTEVEHKSKELANSTISMVKKNEFLLELKEIILNQKEQMGTRYPDKYFNSLIDKIDMNISSQDDWKLFETNFERAHEQFLTKLKTSFPDLTPGDLRLCAFLRMNLASKEIAPLLGISVRGVENHRYRLRKKFDLDNDENLTGFLMTL